MTEAVQQATYMCYLYIHLFFYLCLLLLQPVAETHLTHTIYLAEQEGGINLGTAVKVS